MNRRYLSTGEFGVIYRAQLYEGTEKQQTVAVKTLKGTKQSLIQNIYEGLYVRHFCYIK